MIKITSHRTSCLFTTLAATAALTIFATAAHALPVPGPGATLYVANGNANTVDAIASNGANSLFASNALNDPFGLAFDSSGNLYVSSFNGTTIEKFTPNGVGSVFASGLSSPSGLAFDSAGNLYVGNFGNNTIEKFTPAGVGSVFASTGLNGPTGLAFDSAGNLYVANWNANTIEKFDTSGNGTLFVNVGLDEPSGLAFDSAGNLYVANYGSTTVDEFAPNSVGSIFASGLSAPSGLAFDGAGNLYVANYGNNTIDEFTPAGVGSVFVSSGLNIPLMLAFAPTPAVLPELQGVQAAVATLPVTKLGDKLTVAVAFLALKEATGSVNWVNNNQATVKGGGIVYGDAFIAEEALELVLANNRSNATLTAQIQPLIAQLEGASRNLAAIEIANNPTSKSVSQAKTLLSQGDATADPGAAIVIYYLAWATIAG
jgi:sugar lactone lactonase YvrE